MGGRRRRHGPAFSFVGSRDRLAQSPREEITFSVPTAAGLVERARRFAGNGLGTTRDVLVYALLRGISAMEREAHPLVVAPEDGGRAPVARPHAGGAE